MLDSLISRRGNQEGGYQLDDSDQHFAFYPSAVGAELFRATATRNRASSSSELFSSPGAPEAVADQSEDWVIELFGVEFDLSPAIELLQARANAGAVGGNGSSVIPDEVLTPVEVLDLEEVLATVTEDRPLRIDDFVPSFELSEQMSGLMHKGWLPLMAPTVLSDAIGPAVLYDPTGLGG